jgi:hypothetical protein
MTMDSLWGIGSGAIGVVKGMGMGDIFSGTDGFNAGTLVFGEKIKVAAIEIVAPDPVNIQGDTEWTSFS